MAAQCTEREGGRQDETREYVQKEMGSSPKLMWSIEITYLLNLTEPRSVTVNGDQSYSLAALMPNTVSTVPLKPIPNLYLHVPKPSICSEPRSHM